MAFVHHIELWVNLTLTKVLETAAVLGRSSSASVLSVVSEEQDAHLDPAPSWFPLCEWRLRASATEHEWRARLSVGSVSRGHFVLDRELENTLVPAGAVVQAETFPSHCCLYHRIFRTFQKRKLKVNLLNKDLDVIP